MSGRVRWVRDGTTVVGHRKTDRRQGPRRPLTEKLKDVSLAGITKVSGKEVRLSFPLPNDLQAFVAPGRHGAGIEVLAKGFVRITSGSVDGCFNQARQFLATISQQRAAFTLTTCMVRSEDPDTPHHPHLTIVGETMVVSGGVTAPRVFEKR